MATQITDMMFNRYFKGRRMKGVSNPEFIEALNGPFVALVCATLYHAISQWKTGYLYFKLDFNKDNYGDEFHSQCS